jgi:hypothetical protein
MSKKNIFGEPIDIHLRNLKGEAEATLDFVCSLRSLEILSPPTREEVLLRINRKVRKRLGGDFSFNGRYCYIGQDTSWEYFVKESLKQSDEGDYFTGKEVVSMLQQDKNLIKDFFSKYSVVFLYPFIDDYTFSNIAMYASMYSCVLGINWDDRLNHGYKSWWKSSWSHVDGMLSQRSESEIKYVGMGLNWLFFPEAAHISVNSISRKPIYEKGLVHIGSLDANKGNIANQILKELGNDLVLYGNGTPNGFIDPAESPAVYSSYAASLALSSAGWGFGPTHLKCRHFEIPCSGGLMIAEYTKDLEKVYQIDKEILTFRTVKEAALKYNWVLENPEKANTIRVNGFLKAKEHTWTNRFKTIIFELT